MENTENFNYRQERFAADEFLVHFSDEINNKFDELADTQINDIKKKIKEVQESLKGISVFDVLNNDQPDHEYFYLMDEEKFLTEQIMALYEMKIIYAYKFFELNVKRLVRAFYPKTPIRNLYQWDVLMDFFKSNDIGFGKLNSYNDLNDLRKVNNNLKHSSTVDNEILKIKEFTKEGAYNYEELHAFYERIKKAPIAFLQSLADAINNERYLFDDEKLEAIADSLARRMEPDDAQKLIQILKAKYN